MFCDTGIPRTFYGGKICSVAIGESFWQKESFLQYTMTLLQGPKDPVLTTLIYIVRTTSFDDQAFRKREFIELSH